MEVAERCVNTLGRGPHLSRGENMPMVSKPCVGCGAEFLSWPSHGRAYCSRSCSDKFGRSGRQAGDRNNGKTVRTCDHCKVLFENWPSQIGRFCSRACSDAHRRNRRTFECLACGAEKTVKAGMLSRFCSPACHYGYEKLTVDERRARQRQANYRRRSRTASVPSEPYTMPEIAGRDAYRCALCRRRVNMSLRFPNPKSPSIDHIVPLSDGGWDVRANVQLAHLGCNSRKGHRAVGEQLRLIG